MGGGGLCGGDAGWGRNKERGTFFFTALPADIAQRFPLDAWNDPSRWNVSGLEPITLRFTRNYALEGGQNHGNGNFSLVIPRKTWALWIGDTWTPTSRLTMNLGMRWDVDWGATAPPLVNETQVLINNGFDPANFDVGYRNGIRDLTNVGPRAGFTYKATEAGPIIVRGGGGLFYSTQSSNLTFSQQLFNGQRIIVNAFPNDGKPGFLEDPTPGLNASDFLSGRVPLAPQTPSVIAHDYKSPRTVQASFGMQQQIGDGIGFDSDLTYYRGMNLGINRDINLFYDPNTGYNVPPQLGRPRPDFGPITWYESTAKADYFALASSFTRRYRKNWQAGLTYTLLFFRHDMGTGQSGYSGALNNVFCIACEWATSPDFQRHTFRANGISKAPPGGTLAASDFFGSGSPFAAVYAAS